MPPLDDAYIRAGRGNEHLVELKVLSDAVCSAQAKATIVEGEHNRIIKPGEFAKVVEVETAKTPIPDKVRVLIGDAANSFRSSLNYLVNQLAILNSGVGKRRNQFVIEDTPDKFRKSSRTGLEGLSAAHIAAIEGLQPYNGTKWTGTLARLSNMDKHDNLVLVAHDYLFQIIVDEATVDPTNTDSVVRKVKMRIQPVLRIQLGDGMPVVETLEAIESQVSHTLDAFKSEFE